MNRIRLLLADDYSLIRNGIKLVLEKNPEFEIISEKVNGKEVIEYLTENPKSVDVVLMDINMPELNGIQATKIITKKFKKVKVLCLSMHAEQVYISDMIKAGALGYVLKDANTEDLVHAIKTVASGEKYYSNEVSQALINSLVNGEFKNEPSLLSKREMEVLDNVVKGFTNKKIGEILNISSRTVETHRKNIYSKLDVKNSAEMIRVAVRNNLVAYPKN